MEKELDLKRQITSVVYDRTGSKILIIEARNLPIDASVDFYTHGSGGGFSSLWIRDIPLDEVINLRDRLTTIINEKTEILNNLHPVVAALG